MNYQERAQAYAAQEQQWALDDEHTMRHGGYTGPPFNTRPPGVLCGLSECDANWPFAAGDYDAMRAAGWCLVAYGSMRDYVEPWGQVVKARPRHWVCPQCAKQEDG